MHESLEVRNNLRYALLLRDEVQSNWLPAYCHARVLILGVGNILFGDDGFGPAVVERLQDHYLIPDDLYLMDVGTGVRKLLFTLVLSDTRPVEIVVVDAVDWGLETGRVTEIQVKDLPATKIDDFSLHQVPTSNLLRELENDCGIKVSVVVCDVGSIPKIIAPGLSFKTRQAVVIASEKIALRFALREKMTTQNTPRHEFVDSL